MGPRRRLKGKKFIELNKNEYKIYRNLWDMAMLLPRGKFIALLLMLKRGKSQINNLSTHWKVPEKEKLNKPKARRRKVIMKVRAENNEIESRKTLEKKINVTKS